MRLPEIAKELGVQAVVEGSVLRSGNRVGITVRLIEAATDRQLWTEKYEEGLLGRVNPSERNRTCHRSEHCNCHNPGGKPASGQR